eukprot:TRINITY_DN5333_c0_g1_i1.p1 TRINITY_DN5333_c0_g1~~TRINITY_DN5333_c0_g1_i1.p1  ORF type:complete len:205 (+),score=18.75 TRINITY_DN5333_c0_g1_i1:61-675(+)
MPCWSFGGKRIVMTGASIIRFASEALRKLLLSGDSADWKISDYQTTSGAEVTTNLAGSVNVTYLKHVFCGRRWGLEELERPDILIATRGSHVWLRSSATWNEGLLDMHSKMLAGTYWPGGNVSWVWMTTNPFNPAMDNQSWKLKVLAALPRFEEMNREQKAIVGDTLLVDWFTMATPMLMYTFDQVHFPLWAYRELAKVMAHSL